MIRFFRDDYITIQYPMLYHIEWIPIVFLYIWYYCNSFCCQHKICIYGSCWWWWCCCQLLEEKKVQYIISKNKMKATLFTIIHCGEHLFTNNTTKHRKKSAEKHLEYVWKIPWRETNKWHKQKGDQLKEKYKLKSQKSSKT